MEVRVSASAVVVVIARRRSVPVRIVRVIAVITGRCLVSVLIVKLPTSFTVRMIAFPRGSVMPVEGVVRVVSVMIEMMMLGLIVSRVVVRPRRLLADAILEGCVCVSISHGRRAVISGVIRMISRSIVAAVVLVIRVDVMFVFRIAIHLH